MAHNSSFGGVFVGWTSVPLGCPSGVNKCSFGAGCRAIMKGRYDAARKGNLRCTYFLGKRALSEGTIWVARIGAGEQ